ncbi:MAG: polysaccharide biosynthesis/export family protein [Litorimonas sp.]
MFGRPVIQTAPALSRQPARGTRYAVALLFGSLIATSGTAQTSVERGDVLRIEVMNAPEFSREVSVDMDGRIALHVLGAIPVAGKVSEVIATDIAEAFKARGVLTTPVVLVEIAAYRKVYVGGAVNRPGAIEFVPGMTARQAFVAAGGLRFTEDNRSETELHKALAERRAAGFRLAQVVARIARLEAQIAGEPNLRATEPLPIALANDTLSAREAEAKLLSDMVSRAHAEQAHADGLLDLVALEVEALSQQASLQLEESQIQQAEIDTARNLVERGLLPRPRLQELLREQSRLSRDRLETSAFEARARQQAVTVSSELMQEILTRRSEARLDLQDARNLRTELEAKIAMLDMRALTGGSIAGAGARAQLIIHRSAAGVTRRIEADFDDSVVPGDVLVISLELEPIGSGEDADAVLTAPEVVR